MMCSLLALAVNMVILFYDALLPVIVAAGSEIKKVITKKGENGQQNASSDGQPKLDSMLAAQKGQKLVI
jgi:hypothetical protein